MADYGLESLTDPAMLLLLTPVYAVAAFFLYGAIAPALYKPANVQYPFGAPMGAPLSQPDSAYYNTMGDGGTYSKTVQGIIFGGRAGHETP